jgi:hypothetical protein
MTAHVCLSSSQIDYEETNRDVAKVCAGQTETGEADAMFILESGATLANVRPRRPTKQRQY